MKKNQNQYFFFILLYHFFLVLLKITFGKYNTDCFWKGKITQKLQFYERK